MSLQSLDNLVKIGQLKTEAMNSLEFIGLLHSGQSRLKDAMNITLAIESRFDLAYNAAHALSLAALRWHGYRSGNRYVVFQALPHTLGVGPDVWRVLLNEFLGRYPLKCGKSKREIDPPSKKWYRL